VIEATIPGFGELRLLHVVFDYNGTLALDGALLPGVAAALTTLAGDVHVHVITADTFGGAAAELAGLPVRLTVLAAEAQTEAKRGYVTALGAAGVAAVGNGRNDAQMLAAARLGIALVQGEGCAAETLAAADVVAGGVLEAVALLRSPRRLIATLRS
jgi:soluble P-type ATPase